MKRLFLKSVLAVAGLFMANAAWADTTIGNVDNSTSFEGAFSGMYTLPANKTLHLEFTNYTAGGANYQNFLVYLSNSIAQGIDGHEVYAVMRADNATWGTYADAATRQSNWNWENFTTIMNGAKVSLDVVREGKIVYVTADVTGSDANAYYQKYYVSLDGKAEEDINVYLSVDHSHIVIDDTKTTTVNSAKSPEGSWEYSNDFSSSTGLTISGGGSFVTDAVFGHAFQNVGGAKRTNYLIMPSDLLSHSVHTQQLSIGFWVNKAEATGYEWAPIFSAYGAAPTTTEENIAPCFTVEYRGTMLVNNHGWSDYVDKQNKASVNTLYHNGADWLSDGDWHYMTIVLDGNNAKIYMDGIIANEWNAGSYNDGTDHECTQRGLFYSGSQLSYICLGGNQAWNWGDNDPAFKFAKFYACNTAMTAEQIATKMIEDKSITKTIGTAGWATLCSEYALDFTGTIANLEAAYAITGHSGSTLELTKINQVVAAGEGILLKGSGECKFPIKGSGTAVAGNLLKGVTANTVKDANSIYVLMSETNGVGFYKNNKAFTVGAGTAYLEASAVDAARSFFLLDGETTGINDATRSANMTGEFYNLSGQRIAHPTKGLYIMNGKKVIVK